MTVVLVVIEVVAGVVLVVASGQIRPKRKTGHATKVTCGLRPVTLQFHSMTLNYQGSPEANGL